MTNEKVCRYMSKVDAHRCGKDYVADQLVKEGYGQTCGGYYNNTTINRESAEPNQKLHFLNYYGNDKKDKYPSYNQLHCPQLILWIAEVAGVKEEKLFAAKKCIINYEDNCAKDLIKNGSYLKSGDGVEKKFKDILNMTSVNRIIKESSCWEEVCEKVHAL